MSFLKRFFGYAVEQAQEVDTALATCQFESGNKDCSLVQQLKDKQTQKRAIDNKIKSYDLHSADNIRNFFLLLCKMEAKGIEMTKYDRGYPFMVSNYSSVKDCFERSFGMARLEEALDEISEEGVAAIGEELNALKKRAIIMCDLRPQSAELGKEIAQIKAQLGIE